MTGAFFACLLLLDVLAALLLSYSESRRSTGILVAAALLALPSAIFLIWLLVAVGWALIRGN